MEGIHNYNVRRKRSTQSTRIAPAERIVVCQLHTDLRASHARTLASTLPMRLAGRLVRLSAFCEARPHLTFSPRQDPSSLIKQHVRFLLIVALVFAQLSSAKSHMHEKQELCPPIPP
ncbi:hypothetical protein LIA77_04966 [Sarocladium implicatum]|nr:hypothetical protein LIA77_04966 [Sarocladium implicatum]